MAHLRDSGEHADYERYGRQAPRANWDGNMREKVTHTLNVWCQVPWKWGPAIQSARQ